ncbi:MAG TPA: hypothetical protein DHW65_05800 [Dehalococcoidia bacterium]|nr:hypothetical protein [Dehalococcoidia bacterium]
MSRGFYNEPGDYLRSSYANRNQTTELDKPDIGFALVSGGDTLYGAKLPSESDPITGVFTVDQMGQPTDQYLTAFEITDWNTYHGNSWRNVVIEDGIAYWVGFIEGRTGYSVELLAASVTDPYDFTVYEFDITSIGKEITGFNSTIDADGGYVLIKPFYEGGDRSKVLVYDTTQQSAEIFDTGFYITDAQLLYLD